MYDPMKCPETPAAMSFLRTKNFRNFPVRAQLPLCVLRFLSGCFGSTAKAEAFSRCILLVFLEVKLLQAHLLPSASHFHVFFFFNSTFHFAILSCFNPAETFHSAFRMFVYIRVPPNNAINGSTPSLGPRLSLFSEVSYYKKLVWVPQIFNICRNALGHLMKFTQHSVLWAGPSRFTE